MMTNLKLSIVPKFTCERVCSQAHCQFVPHQIPCPSCTRIGLVRVEHVITGKLASRAYYCGGCDHEWCVDEHPPIPPPTFSPLPKARTRRYGPKRARN
jgi:hypothetical protein